METIDGNRADHEDLIRWARQNNEKILDFVVAVDMDVPFEEMRVVFKAPFRIYNWMRYNCYINCMQNHFRERYGDDYLET